MPSNGDSYIVTLKPTHLGWGTYRLTKSRERIIGEGYLPIPSQVAKQYSIYNSNYGKIGLGFNEFFARTEDGFFEGRLKASGNSKAGDIYAKNLHGSGNLKALGRWFNEVNMRPGDQVKLEWISPTEIILKMI